MKQFFKLYGPVNGLVCLGLGLLFFLFNVILIEAEGKMIRLLVFTPMPLILCGLSLILWPGLRLSRKEVHEQNISFWSKSPTSHKIAWLIFGLLGISFLVLQLLDLFGMINVSIHNCFLARYFGLGSC